MASKRKQTCDLTMQIEGSAEGESNIPQSLTDQYRDSVHTKASHIWDTTLDLFIQQHKSEGMADWKRQVDRTVAKGYRRMKQKADARLCLYCDDLYLKVEPQVNEVDSRKKLKSDY